MSPPRAADSRLRQLAPLTAYGLAVMTTAAALLLRLALVGFWGTTVPFILFYPAIMVTGWLGGLGAGLVATFLAALSSWYFLIEPLGSWTISRPSQAVALGLFTLVGVVLSAVNEAWRREARRAIALADANLDLLAKEREVEERLRVTISSISDAVIATDDHGRVTQLNGAAEALTGWKQSEAHGRPVEEVFVIVNEQSRRPVASPVEKVLREGDVSGLANHTLLIARDGREIPIEDSAAPIRTGDKTIVGVVMIFRDATARRLSEREKDARMERERSAHGETERARAELAATSEQLRTALQAGRMGTWEYTIGAREVRWSPGLEAIHGYSPGTFPGTFEAFRDEIHPDDRDGVLEAIRAAAEGRAEHHVEYRIVRRDGSVRWVEGRGQLFPDAEGRPHRMLGVCVDVTDRKASEEKFQLAIEAAPTAMILVDERGTIVLANALTERLLGFGRNDIVGRSVEQLVPPRFRGGHPGHRSGFLADPRQRPMGAGRELYALRHDGVEVPVEIGLSPIRTSEGVFVLAAVTDISERRLVERERASLLVREQHAREELERASRLKDDFLAVLSHELRTPLNAVLGYTDLLSSGVVSGERSAHALAAIRRNAEAQSRLIESLLDLSRIIAGKLELEIERLDLAAVLHGALDVIRPEADRKGVALEVASQPHPIVLNGDPVRLQQVFWNLLSNAVKFTPREGRIEVRATQCNSAVEIRITDNGEGIEPDFLPFVFDRFKQAAREGGRAAGLGLGLALVREMVLAHRGTVVAESAGVGLGSTFVVTLPALPSPPADESRGQTIVRR